MSSLRVLLSLSAIVAVHSSCTVPPEFWCDTPETAEACAVTPFCAKYSKTVAGRKVKLTLLYESLCPDCQRFTLETLYPDVFENLMSIVDLKIIPFGNAREHKNPNGTYSYDCQHGERECKLNRFQACAIQHMRDVRVWFPFYHCMEQRLKNGQESVQACYSDRSVSSSLQNEIQRCVVGKEGEALMHRAAQDTAAVAPTKHEFVPWIVINDVSTLSMQNNQDIVAQTICKAYRGPPAPPQFCTEL